MAKIRQLALAGAAVGLLASCGPQGGLDLNNFDPDFRGWGGGGLDTANAAAQAMPRPASYFQRHSASLMECPNTWANNARISGISSMPRSTACH